SGRARSTTSASSSSRSASKGIAVRLLSGRARRAPAGRDGAPGRPCPAGTARERLGTLGPRPVNRATGGGEAPRGTRSDEGSGSAARVPKGRSMSRSRFSRPVPSHRSSPDPLRRRRRRVAVAGCALALLVLAACQPSPPPKTFTFSGGGWGHGVGMSQYGALGMAKAGHNHVQILTTYYPGTEVVTRAPSDDLRVLVAERRPTLTFVTGGTTTFGAAGTVPAFKTVTMTRSGNSVRLGGALSATVPALTITFSGDLRIGETGNAYRYGRVAVRPDPAGGLRAVVTNLTMNQYLYGIAEMPASWHTQALRAQAVAARTFAQRRRDSRAGQGLDYDLLATVTDQVYSGTRHEHERWTSAVNVTNAQFLTYKGALAETVYSSS